MSTASAIRAGLAYVTLELRDDKFTAGLKAAEKAVSGFGHGMKEVGQGVMGAGLKIAGAGLAVEAALGGAVAYFVSYGRQLEIMSQRTGISTAALAELGYVAKLGGADLGAVEHALRHVATTMLAAGAGSAKATQLLDDLGLSFDDLRGKSTDEVFRAMAAAIAKVENPIKRMGLAVKAFGRGGLAMLPLLGQLDALGARFKALGLTVDESDVKAAGDLGRAWEETTEQLKMVAFQAGAALAPALMEVIRVTQGVLKGVIAWTRENKGLVITVALVAGGVVLAGGALATFGAIVTAVAVAVIGLDVAAGILLGVLGAIGSVVAFLLTPLGLVIVGVGLLVAAVVALGAYWLYTSGKAGEALDWIAAKFKQLWAVVGPVWAGIVNAVKAGDLQLAFDIIASGLKITWLKLTDVLVSRWETAEFKLVDGWWKALGAIEDALGSTVAFLAGVWDTFIGTIAGKLGKLEGAAAGLAQAFGGIAAAPLAKAAAEQARVLAGLEAKGDINGIRQGIADRQAGRAREREDRLNKQGAAENGRGADIQKEQDNLAELLKRAKAAAEAQAVLPPAAQPPPLDEAHTKIGSVGTFSGALAGQLVGSGGPEERTATATEEMRRILTEIWREAKRGGGFTLA